MNRGHVLKSFSPVQQMMATGGPAKWWNINNTGPPPPQQPSPFLAPPPPHLFPQYAPSPSWHDNNQDLPTDSWSQLLVSGFVGEEDKSANLSHINQAAKKLENWEEQLLLHDHHQPPNLNSLVDTIKQENSANSNYIYGGHGNVEVLQGGVKPSWIQASSPKSCVTSLGSNMLDFCSTTKADGSHPPPDRSSQCNSTATGGATKKAKVQPSSTQSTFKVRKEKLGDRITALHQLVSPFGKTDTASVLLEAIGYIRFLQSQIEALSLPYLGSGSGNMRLQHSVQGERNCLFPEDPGQLLNDNCMKRKGAPEQDSHEESKKDLRSRGLCVVPVSCTMQVGSDNGADYWAPALNGGFR